MLELELRNHGPIREASIELRKFNVIIGPQASGKSTVAKTAHFFSTLREDLIAELLYGNDGPFSESGNGPKAWFNLRLIRQRFVRFFGVTRAFNPDFSIIARFGDGKELHLTLDERGYVRNRMNREFREEYETAIGRISELVERMEQLGAQRNREFSAIGARSADREVRRIYEDIDAVVADLFDDSTEHVFIPASRSLLTAVGSDYPKEIAGERDTLDADERAPTVNVDYVTRAFLERVERYRHLFDRPLEQIVDDARFNLGRKAHGGALSRAIGLIHDVLRGGYEFDGTSGRITFGENSIPVHFASSGQQESVWMMLVAFRALLEGVETSFIVEEPESHLFPEAQERVLQLLVLVTRALRGSLLLTTHSPYIPFIMNLFAKAGEIGGGADRNAGLIDQTVPRDCWLQPIEYGGWAIEDGILRDISDSEFGGMSADLLDRASDDAAARYDRLLNLSGALRAVPRGVSS